jgi:hypothetical protein
VEFEKAGLPGGHREPCRQRADRSSEAVLAEQLGAIRMGTTRQAVGHLRGQGAGRGHVNLGGFVGSDPFFGFPSGRLKVKSKVSLRILDVNCERSSISPKTAQRRDSAGWRREGCVESTMIRLPQTAATNPEQTLVRPPCGD